MFVFTHPDLVRGHLDHAITRKNGNQYSLVLSKPSGFIYDREISRLNVSTSPSTTPLPLSSEGRPLIWMDCSTDRGYRGIPNGALTALLAADPRPPIKLTGRIQRMSPPASVDLEDDERDVQEVELLLSEDELLHSCYYCSALEIHERDAAKFAHVGGKGYSSTYGCEDVSISKCLDEVHIVQLNSQCMRKSWVTRTIFDVQKYWGV